MMTGSDGVSFLLPQLFLSQHRLQRGERRRWGGGSGGVGGRDKRGVSHQDVNNRESEIRYNSERQRKSDERTGKEEKE